MKYDVVIVGAGPAGIFTAIELIRRGSKQSILIVEKGQPIEKALELTNKAVVEALGGLPTHKIHCSVLAEQAIKAALADYYTRLGVDPTPFVGELHHDCDHCESCGH